MCCATLLLLAFTHLTGWRGSLPFVYIYGLEGNMKLKILFVLTVLATLIGCSVKGTQKSFISALDEVDVLIRQQRYDEAAKRLSVIEKKATNSLTILGIYRRYGEIGEAARGRALLKKSVKSHKGDVELLAVYSNLLLKDGEVAEAIKVAKPLQGTTYGSLYSEALLRDSAQKLVEAEDSGLATYLSGEYIPIYLDAYSASGNPSYLRNAALINLSQGKYEEVFGMRPDECKDAHDGFFWAVACFDGQFYGDAITYLEAARKKTKDQGILLHILSLETDSYTALREDDEAQKLRKNFIATLQYKDGEWILPLINTKEVHLNTATPLNDTMFCAIFVNAARFAFDNDDPDSCAQYITYAVNKWPLFVPALSLYAEFAYQSSIDREESLIQRQIRAAHASTLEMEEYDARARIPMSDALFKVNSALKESTDPMLQVLALDLKHKMDKSASVDDKERDIWNLLEENTLAPGIYPEELFNYALNFMLVNKKQKDAWFLYRSCMHKKYDIPLPPEAAKPTPELAMQNTATFLDGIYEKRNSISQSMLEYGAYFAANMGLTDEAVNLYEAVCEEGLRTSNYSLINMALVYSSTNQKQRALDILQKTVGRSTNMKQKSMIMYRIALIYYTSGDTKNAKQSVEYAITLNNRNADARLLASRIRG